MMAGKNTIEEILVQKFDTLIRLQARVAVSHLDTQKQKILFLSSAGLPPKDIGEILGVSANSVSVALSQAKKASKPEAGAQS